MTDRVCGVVIAQFIFGAERCKKTAVSTIKCEQWPRCTIDHPACAEHSTTQEQETQPIVPEG